MMMEYDIEDYSHRQVWIIHFADKILSILQLINDTLQMEYTK
jgi:hypothetical protein